MLLKDLLKNGRADKGMTTRQVSETLKIDQALVSKFENGQRRPTRKQLEELTNLFGLNPEETVLAWLSEKIISEIENEPLGLKALKMAEEKLNSHEVPEEVSEQFQKLLKEMESLKAMLGKKG